MFGLSEMTDEITNATDNKKPSIRVFRESTKAFHTVNNNLLIHKLESINQNMNRNIVYIYIYIYINNISVQVLNLVAHHILMIRDPI